MAAINALRQVARANGWTVRNRYPEAYGEGNGVDFIRDGHKLRVNTDARACLTFAWLDDQPVQGCRTPSVLAAILCAPREG